jgi:prepilin-type N-terminal cleavage/methylation domain-containing protein
MLSRHLMRNGVGRGIARAGFTLAEILLVLVLGALVLGIVTTVGTRLQHQLSTEAVRQKGSEQLAEAAELLPLELRGTAPPSGDIAEASDSVLQYRATIANGIVCGGSASTLLVASFLGAGARILLPAVQGGDTLWSFADADMNAVWEPHRIIGWRRITSPCSAVDATASAVLDVAHLWSAELRDSVTLSAGTLVRVTRPERLSFYRSGDGQWYLGMRSWNSAAVQFNGVQPLSGPYLSPAQTSGSRFRYYDASGAALPLGTAASGSIARVEMLLVAATDQAVAVRDSLLVVVALRNR